MKDRGVVPATKVGSSAARRRLATSPRVAALRTRGGETLEPASFTATEAKSEFGRALELAIQGRAVVITKHDVPKAVMLSVENVNALSGAAQTSLDRLNEEFDALLSQMQTARSRRGMKVAFAASGRELGRAAVAAARGRG